MKALAFSIFLLILGGMMARFTLTTSHFRIREIQVRGEKRLSEDEIREWADIPLGRSIFEVSLRKIAQRISPKPQVKKVEIRRILPSSLTIMIEERTPFAQFFCQDLLWEVDEEGVIMGKARSRGHLPIITGIGSLSQLERIRLAVKILRIFKQGGLSLSRVEVEDKNGIIGYLEEGTKIYLGRGIGEKYLSYIPLILADAKREKIKYLDLRFEKQVVVRPQ